MSETTAAPRSPVAQPSNSAAPLTEDQVLLSVSKALRAHKLLRQPDQCYVYRFEPASGQSAYNVEIRESHAHPVCGGDPQTQPRLFTVHMDKSTQALTTDAQSAGIFQPLQP